MLLQTRLFFYPSLVYVYRGNTLSIEFQEIQNKFVILYRLTKSYFFFFLISML